MAITNGYAFAAPVTPSDIADQPPFDALQVSSIAGGASAVIRPGLGSDVTYAGLTVGLIIPIKCKRVLSTGTLASFVGLRAN